MKKIIRAAKRAKEIDLAKNRKSDSKKFFSFYKINSKTKSIGPLKANDQLVSDDGGMVSLLSNQFSSVFTVEDQGRISLLQTQCVTSEAVEELDDITSDVVRRYLKRVKPNKAEGPDEIYARILLECEKELSVPLAIIFLSHLLTQKFPLTGREQMLYPFLKKVTNLM